MAAIDLRLLLYRLTRLVYKSQEYQERDVDCYFSVGAFSSLVSLFFFLLLLLLP